MADKDQTIYELDDATIASLRNPPKDEESTADDETDEDIKEDIEDGEEEEFTPTQQAAMEQGWRPEEEWDGDPEDWVDAKEFLYRGQLMDRISKQNKALTARDKEFDQMKAVIGQLKDHNKKMREVEYNRALKQLKREKVDALDENDTHAVMEIEDQIDELTTSYKEYEDSVGDDDFIEDEENESSAPQYSEEDLSLVRNWAAKNSAWHNKDKAMTAVADRYADEYLANNPEDVQGMLKYVDREIRKEFPHKFKSTKKGAAVTESGRRTGKKSVKRGKSNFSEKDLTDEQQHVARGFAKLGVMTVQEYVEQLAEAGELSAQQGE